MGVTVTGTITTQNLNPTTGTATAGSFIKLADRNSSTYRDAVGRASVQVTGTYTGALTPQLSNDGITWVAVGPNMVFNLNAGTYAQTIASGTTGVFNVFVGGAKYFRISANAAVTGTANISINGTDLTPAAGLSGSFTLSDKLAGEDFLNDILKVEDRSSYVQLTASGLAKTGSGRAKGIFVTNATATPTIKVWDNTAASGAVLLDTFAPTAPFFYKIPNAEFGSGLYITISGTVSCTVFFK